MINYSITQAQLWSTFSQIIPKGNILFDTWFSPNLFWLEKKIFANFFWFILQFTSHARVKDFTCQKLILFQDPYFTVKTLRVYHFVLRLILHMIKITPTTTRTEPNRSHMQVPLAHNLKGWALVQAWNSKFGLGLKLKLFPATKVNIHQKRLIYLYAYAHKVKFIVALTG